MTSQFHGQRQLQACNSRETQNVITILTLSLTSFYDDRAAFVPRAAADSELMTDSELSISKVSFGSILTPVGLGLLGYGFSAYFQLLPGGDLSSLMLIYGFPISLLGFALSYAQVRDEAPVIVLHATMLHGCMGAAWG